MKSDRRTRYTKMVIQASLLELMKEQPISKITISQLCIKADINRGTFYAHYRNPEEVYKQIENNLYEEVRQSLINGMEDTSPSSLLYRLLLLIKKNQELCQLIFHEYSDSTILKDILFMAQDLFMKEWISQNQTKSEAELQYTFQFLAHGCIGVIKCWFADGMKEDVIMIVDTLLKLIEKVIPINVLKP